MRTLVFGHRVLTVIELVQRVMRLAGCQAVADAAKLAAAAPVAGAESAHDSLQHGEPFCSLQVAFTPYGPDVLHWWLPAASSAQLQSDIRKGDIQ